jgi:hypothetical protein
MVLPADPGTHTIASLTNDDDAGVDAPLAGDGTRLSRQGNREHPARHRLDPAHPTRGRDRPPTHPDHHRPDTGSLLVRDGDEDGDGFGDGEWLRDRHRAWWPAGQVRPVEDPVAAYRALVDATVGALEPLVGAVGDRVPFAPRRLWRYVMEPFSAIAPQAPITDPTLAHAECEVFQAGARGSRLGQRLRFVEFDCDGHARSQIRRPACCYSHAWPIPPADIKGDGETLLASAHDGAGVAVDDAEALVVPGADDPIADGELDSADLATTGPSRPRPPCAGVLGR